MAESLTCSMLDELDAPEELENNDDDDDLYLHQTITVDKGQSLLRIDKFLMDRIQNATRNRVQTAIDDGFVKVNDKNIKANYKVKPFDIITIELPKPPRSNEILPENIPLNIVYEDDDLLVVNKPAGMVVHPAYNNWSGTLVNALVYHFNNLPVRTDHNPGLVHRIDKDTSGLLVIAKTDHAMSFLARQFHDHTIERTYYAMAWGEFEEEKGTIRADLGRSPYDRREVIVYPDGKGRHAVTHYKVLKAYRYVTLIQCNLETGRTHQIRSHMRHLGHPLFNDAAYGGDRIHKGTVFSKYKAFVDNCFKVMPRQALHAKSLGFIHPTTKEFMQFDSELPLDFKMLIQKWENYSKEVD